MHVTARSEVVPAGFEKRPARRGSYVACWLVDVAFGLVLGFVTWVLVSLALVPFGVRHHLDGTEAELSTWAVALAVGAGCVAAVCCMAFGTGGRSMGHAVAELRIGRQRRVAASAALDRERVDDLVLVPASPARRAVRAAAPVVVLLGVGRMTLGLGLVVAVLLWLPSLLRADRRGPYERIAGIADVTLEPLPGRAPR
jgi:hypothetical protein